MQPKSELRPILVLNVAETIKGGVATYLAALEAGADRVDCRFSFLVPESQWAELDAGDMHCHSASRSILGMVRLALRILEVRRKTGAQVIFAHSTFAGIALCLAQPFLGRKIRTIYCPHGWAVFRDARNSIQRLVGAVERVMSLIPSVVVNISRYEHEGVMRKGFSKRCVLITNAVHDVEARRTRLESCNRPLKVLYVGRFDRQKGVDMLLYAIRELGPDVGIEFDLIGGHVLADAALQLPDLPNVRYHGWLPREEVAAFYVNSDVVVMPSRWEGFGLCAIEAFRAGTPVLARRVGALPEIVSHGHDGYLFDGEADVLMDVLKRLDLGDLGRMRANARQTFESRFHIDGFYRSYKALFSGLMDGRSRVCEARGRQR